MSNSIILITGITGQICSYVAEYFLYKNFDVHGVIRRSASFNTGRIDHIFNKLHLHFGDLSDGGNIANIINEIRPDIIINGAAMSQVRVSFDIPDYTNDIDSGGVIRILEAVRRNPLLRYKTRIYQFSSSELFGISPPPQNINTPMIPRSPYACAKLASFHNCRNYRDGYNMFISNGVLFNCESPRRGETFVTKKITKFIADYLADKKSILKLGNLEAKRDWGFAPEVVENIYKVITLDNPIDIILGTGETHSVREFVEEAFKYVGLPIRWEGTGLQEKGYIYGNKCVIKIDESYFRPTEVESLCADITETKKILNWEPRITFKDIVKIMIDCDLMKLGLPPIGNGYETAQKNFSWSIIR